MFQTLCLEENVLQYIPTYKISQDYLELLLGTIRARGGYNYNPTVRELKTSIKKNFVHTELQSPSSGNCVSLENINILHCSSTITNINAVNIIYMTSSHSRFNDDELLHVESDECELNPLDFTEIQQKYNRQHKWFCSKIFKSPN